MGCAPVLDEQASAGATSDSLNHVDVGDDHLVAGVEDALLLWSHGVESSFTDDHTWLTGIIGDTLSVGSHVLNLFESEVNDAYWVSSVGEGINKGSSLSLVSDGIEAHGYMFGMKTHQAIGMINDVTMLVLGFKGHSLVWEGLTVDSELVESLNQLIDHLDVGSLGQSAVEVSVSVIKYYSSFSFESFFFFLEVGQIDSILVTFLESLYELWRSLVSSGLVLHWVDDKDSFWDGLSFVAGEPVWEY